MDLVEGDFSRNRREAEAARKARLVAIGRKVWLETDLRGAGNISEDDAEALGFALEKAGRWLQTATPRGGLGQRKTLQKIERQADTLRGLLRDGEIVRRLQFEMDSRPVPLPSITELLRGLIFLKAAAESAAKRTPASKALAEYAGSGSGLWIRACARIYERFTGEEAAPGNLDKPGPFMRFLHAASRQEPVAALAPAISRDTVESALKKGVGVARPK